MEAVEMAERRVATSRQTCPSSAAAENVDDFPTSRRPVAAVPRLALSVGEACEALGVGHDFWHEHIAPEVPTVRRGRRKLVPVRELERWLEANAEAVLE
jgi:hypothetical protein